MEEFSRAAILPPYVFSIVDKLKAKVLETGASIIDLGMGNPDQPTPPPIVEELIKAARQEHAHRYAIPMGIDPLRQAMSDWYRRHYEVDLDPKTETIVTIGSKEGLAHLALAVVNPGDPVLVPTPSYPIHTYGFVLAGAKVQHVQLTDPENYLRAIAALLQKNKGIYKWLVLNFPSNPTTQTVELDFFKEIIVLARKHHFYVINDLAYADIVFNADRAPSILQVPHAKEVAVEAFSMSKSFNMPGWRVGFMSGNEKIISTLRHVKSYLDYGLFEPIQRAAMFALNHSDELIPPIRELYRERRDVLFDALSDIGWKVEKPDATMFIWAQIPETYRHMRSLAFCEHVLEKANVALSPGLGFGEAGDEFVRFSLIADPDVLRQACAQIAQHCAF